jgi:hypothetical protein
MKTTAADIVVQVPANPSWCPIRKAVCSWTNAKFPLQTDRQWGFYLVQHPVVTIIGKAFYDIDHSVKNPRRNRRNYDSSFSVWEISSRDEASAKAILSWGRRLCSATEFPYFFRSDAISAS